MKVLFFILSTSLLVSCSVQKEFSVNYTTPTIPNLVNNHTIIKSRVLESQRRLADSMDSWSQERIDAFKRDYVYSEVNFFLKNGDTLTVK
jgi:hypothetical protein